MENSLSIPRRNSFIAVRAISCILTEIQQNLHESASLNKNLICLLYNIPFIALSQLNGDSWGSGSGVGESSSKNAANNSTISGDDDKTTLENTNLNKTEGKKSFRTNNSRDIQKY